jgi:hypothetical protein
VTLLVSKKSEICISKIATLKQHSLPHGQKVERKIEHGFKRISISNKTPQTINKKENLWGYRIGTVSGKNYATGGLTFRMK